MRLAYNDSKVPAKPDVVSTLPGATDREVVVTFSEAMVSAGALFAGGRNNSECGRVPRDSAAVDLAAIAPDQRNNYTVSRPGASECAGYTISGTTMTVTCPTPNSIIQMNGHGSCYL